MIVEDELFTVSCIGCNCQTFQFSKNLLENIRKINLKCPKCQTETTITYDSISGVLIELV